MLLHKEHSFSLLLHAGMVYIKWACKQDSNKYWCSENGFVAHEVPLHDFKCRSLVCSECSQAYGRNKFFWQFLGEF
jgi:hypothetical protein